MSAKVSREGVLGETLTGICHSQYYDPVVIVEGLGEAVFRSHFLQLSSGIVLDLFTAEVTLASIPADLMPGETTGLPLRDLLGRKIISLVRDDFFSSLVILEGLLFLKDANDGVHENPLVAGRLVEVYDETARRLFVDYWTELPVDWSVQVLNEEKHP